MSNCRASRWFAAVCAVALAAGLAVVGAAVAQDPPEAGAPVAVEPEIAVSALGRVDPLAVGALDPQTGALPASLWSGLDLARAVALVERLEPKGSRAASDLAARVLASPAAAPEGEGFGEGGEALAIARLDALERLGRWDLATAIIQASESSLPGLARPAAWAALARNDLDAACRLAEGGIDPASEDGVRLRSACAAFRGDGPAATLILDLAEDSALSGVDAEFRGWVARAASDTPAGRATPVRDLLEVRLALVAGGPIGEETSRALPISAAAALMTETAAPIVQRAIAGERAANSGAVSAEAYAEVLAGLQGPSGRASSDLLRAALASDGAIRSALLLQAAAEASTDAERAAAIAVALDGAESGPGLHLAARLHASALAALAPDPAFAEHAPVFAEALAALGQSTAARAWLSLRPSAVQGPADLTGAGDVELEASLKAEDAAAVAVMIAAADPDISGVDLAAVAFERVRSAQDLGEVEAARAAADATLLLALGASNTSPLRDIAEHAFAAANELSAETRGALHAMEAAAAAGSLAETALLAAIAIGSAEPGHVEATARAARALWEVGLGDDARAVVIDALLIARRGA